MEYKEFYKEVYSQDNQPTKPYGSVQWKGTEVCIDLYCTCGYHGHYDGEYFSFYECPSCKVKYAVGFNVKLIPLSESQAAEVEEFKTCPFYDGHTH